jgi:hypothetical protein
MQALPDLVFQVLSCARGNSFWGMGFIVSRIASGKRASGNFHGIALFLVEVIVCIHIIFLVLFLCLDY